MSRISRRVIAEQYIALHDARPGMHSATSYARATHSPVLTSGVVLPGYTGVICRELSPLKPLLLCEVQYWDRPLLLCDV
eukprot:812478-Rhodomonas_salina.1